MLKQFYEKVLPKQGVYCLGDFDRPQKKMRHLFAESITELFEQSERIEQSKRETFYAPFTFKNWSRTSENSAFARSFFIDIDVAKGKNSYDTQQEALDALDKFVETAGLPPPVRVDSGWGIHAYWPLSQDIPTEEFHPYAVLFKKLCIEHLIIDPAANSADLARFMRFVGSTNLSHPETPKTAKLLDDDIPAYEFADFKEFLGEPPQAPTNILERAQKGLDEDTKNILKLDNFPSRFSTLAHKCFEGEGCGQITNILVNSANLEEPLWWAGLSIAKFCDDGAEAIHKMSEDYPGYNYDETEAKASRFPAPRTCQWFLDNYPKECDGCKHRGKITSPIALAREFIPAPTNQEESVWEAPSPEKVPEFPAFLFPFVRGANGGIYHTPEPTYDKKTKQKHQDPPELIFPHDLYPVRRMYSPHDGECLLMRLVLPQDGVREFLVPMKGVYSLDNFKSLMSSNGIFTTPNAFQLLMNYVIKWGQFMQTANAAEQMRMQMGWTEERSSLNWADRRFVIGKKEITKEGETIDAPSSPFVRGISRYITQHGTYAAWRESAQFLENKGFELHAFTALCGFASPLMCYTSTSGVVVSLLGKSGSAKTGAMYAGLSAFGQPKELSVFDATANGMTGRYLGLHNLMFGIDEISNKEGKALSQLAHGISHGKAKIRMQGSVNAEREHEMSASLIAVFTTNQSIYNKFEEIKANPDGEAARVVELLVHKPDILEGDDGGSIGRKVFDAFHYNYGHAGPMFIKEILQRGDNYVLDKVGAWSDRFVKDFGDNSTYRFYQNLVAVVGAAGDIAKEHNILAYDMDRVYHEVVRSMIEIRDNVVKVNRTDYPAVLGDYVNRNMGNMLVIKDGKVSMEPRGAIVGRIVSEENLLQVSKTDFKKYLNERQISSREFEFEMREKKLLIDDKKGRLTTGWKTAIHVDPAYLYWFRTELPEGFISDSGSN